MVILEKILNDLKAKLPFLNKAKGQEESEEYEDEEEVSSDDATGASDLAALNDEDEDSSDEEPKSLVDKIKKLVSNLGAKKKTEESEEESTETDAEAAKKKKSKTLQIIIGIALIIFLLSDYIIPPEEPAGEAPAVTTTDEIPEQPETPKEKPVVADTPPVETPQDTPVETPAETPTETPVETVETPAVGEEPTSQPDNIVETPTDSPVEVTSSDSNDDAFSIPIEPESGEVGQDTTGEAIEPGSDDNLTDQILQDLEKQTKSSVTEEPVKEYVSPPDYEYRGRGLVYNCSGKHWACIDAPSYKICEDNASSVKYLNKKVECHPFNVYETTKGCESMQNRMVSSSAKTNFCNE